MEKLAFARPTYECEGSSITDEIPILLNKKQAKHIDLPVFIGMSKLTQNCIILLFTGSNSESYFILYFFLNRSTRPPTVSAFCLPV